MCVEVVVSAVVSINEGFVVVVVEMSTDDSVVVGWVSVTVVVVVLDVVEGCVVAFSCLARQSVEHANVDVQESVGAGQSKQFVSLPLRMKLHAIRFFVMRSMDLGTTPRSLFPYTSKSVSDARLAISSGIVPRMFALRTSIVPSFGKSPISVGKYPMSQAR